MSVDFNAYVHARPDGSVFYVGKGSTKRSLELWRSRNAHHANVVNKYGQENILVGRIPCSSDSISLALEVGLIKCFRRMGVALVNQTFGGEGVTGYRFSEEGKKLVSERTREALVGKSDQMSDLGKDRWADPSYRSTQTARIAEGVQTDAFREARRVQSLGVKYLTDGVVCVAANTPEKIEELLNKGYTFGRLKYKTSEKSSLSAKNRWSSESERSKQSARIKSVRNKKGNNDGC